MASDTTTRIRAGGSAALRAAHVANIRVGPEGGQSDMTFIHTSGAFPLVQQSLMGNVGSVQLSFAPTAQQYYTIVNTTDGLILRKLAKIRASLHKLETRLGTFVAPMTTLVPDSDLELKKDIHVVIQPCEKGNCVATFFDANIGISGDTSEEAFANLRALIADIFEELVDDEHRLGPATAGQLAVLRQFIREKAGQ